MSSSLGYARDKFNSDPLKAFSPSATARHAERGARQDAALPDEEVGKHSFGFARGKKARKHGATLKSQNNPRTRKLLLDRFFVSL